MYQRQLFFVDITGKNAPTAIHINSRGKTFPAGAGTCVQNSGSRLDSCDFDCLSGGTILYIKEAFFIAWQMFDRSPIQREAVFRKRWDMIADFFAIQHALEFLCRNTQCVDLDIQSAHIMIGLKECFGKSIAFFGNHLFGKPERVRIPNSQIFRTSLAGYLGKLPVLCRYSAKDCIYKRFGAAKIEKIAECDRLVDRSALRYPIQQGQLAHADPKDGKDLSLQLVDFGGTKAGYQIVKIRKVLQRAKGDRRGKRSLPLVRKIIPNNRIYCGRGPRAVFSAPLKD